MDILVNGKTLEVTLEKEKVLKEVMGSLEHWIKEENFEIQDIKLDGKTLSLEEALNSEEEIKDVKTLELLVSGFVEQIEEVYPSLKSYLARFQEVLGEGQEAFVADKRQKIEGLTWIVDTTGLIAKSLGISTRYVFHNGRSLEEILNFFDFSISNLTQNIHDNQFFYQYFTEGIASRLVILEKLLDKLLGFYNFLLGDRQETFKASLKEEAKAMQELMANLPGLIQDGRDQDALAFIQKMMGFFESLSLLLSHAGLNEASQNTLLSYKSELVKVFEEIYEAFKTQDVVTVSDLVEYELSDKLNSMLELFSPSV